MYHPHPESATSGPVNILKNYSFESNNLPYEKVLDSWLQRFPLNWVNLAVVESLHQGRYKVVSVEQILTLWQRRGKPSYHFNHDFERLVSNNLPKPLMSEATPSHQSKVRVESSFSRPRGQHSSFTSQQWQPMPEFASLNTSEPEVRHEASLPLFEEVHLSEQDELTLDFEAVEEQTDTALIQEVSNELATEDSPQNSIHALDEEEDSRIDSESMESNSFSVNQDIQPTTQLEAEYLTQDTAEIPTFSPVSQDSTVEFHLNPIHQFVPQTETTEFCAKLTAMAQVNV